MFEILKKAAELVSRHRYGDVQIVSHSDADGVCAAAIVSKCLERRGIEHTVRFVEMPHEECFEDIPSADLTILTDVGSSLLSYLSEELDGPAIILDHHQFEENNGRGNILHVNAHLLGMDGGMEISGAGMAYLFALAVDSRNVDLSPLAVIGAIGDAQDLWGELRGFNRKIAEDAVRLKLLRMDIDLLLYGRHSRPIYKALAGLTDPFIAGVSNSPSGCLQLLRSLSIPVRDGTRLRRLVDLTHAERSRLASELIVRASLGAPPELLKHVPRLVVGETFSLPHERDESGLKDADEFATSLNAVARQDQPIIGLEVAKGDREAHYAQMRRLLARYRHKIAECLSYLEEADILHGPRNYLQFFDATGHMSERMVGTAVGMLLSSGLVDPYRPVLGLVRKGGKAKISARCSRLLALRDVNLAKAAREASREVGGEGGGHATASGALIEESRIEKFIEIFESRLLT